MGGRQGAAIAAVAGAAGAAAGWIAARRTSDAAVRRMLNGNWSWMGTGVRGRAQHGVPST